MRFILNLLGFTGGGGLSVGLNIIDNLPTVAAEHRFLALIPDAPGFEGVRWGDNVEPMVCAVSHAKHARRLLLDQFAIPRLCRTYAADALFTMANFGPYRVPCANVVGIHLGYLAYPVWPVWSRLDRRARILLRARALYFKIFVSKADTLCVLSETAARRMQSEYALDPGRVEIVPNAVTSDAYLDTPDVPSIRDAMTRHPSRMRLCYTALGHPHKNHDVLPEAFSILRNEHGITDVSLFVTVESEDSKAAARFLGTVKARGLSDVIVNLGRLRLHEIATVYRHADGLLMPTLLELVSISYLEAMRFGVPILTSDYDFAREVCEDAALYFDPTDARDVAAAVASLVRHPAEAERLTTLGHARLKAMDISWAEVTRRYVDVLEKAALRYSSSSGR